MTASEDEHPELLWALRGGGPSFGIVVELQFELAIGPQVIAGMIGWPAERTADVAAAYAALMADAPDDLGGGLALLSGPPAAFVPASLHGPLVATAVLWTGAPKEAARILKPLRELAPPIDAVGPMPYATFQGLFERPADVQVPTRSTAEAGFLGELPSAAAAATAIAHERPSPLGSILFQPMGGAFARVEEDATPLGRRDAAWQWQAGTAWFEPADDDRSRAWIADARRTLTPWSAGNSYPNFIPEVDPERLQAAFAPAVCERLRAVRAEWDPDGVFSAGHAIPLPGR